MVRSVQQPQFDSDLRPFAARLPAFLSTLQSNKGKKKALKILLVFFNGQIHNFVCLFLSLVMFLNPDFCNFAIRQDFAGCALK